jgi:hypothetical protein
MLVACGGSQPPIGASGAMPQSRAIATHAGRGRLWMLPEAKSGALIYASSADGGSVYVLSYPTLELVQTLKNLNASAMGECVDSAGDVFVTTVNASETSGTIYEYAHGGSAPIATLNDPGYPWSCAVDSTSGTLAVANFRDSYGSGLNGDLAIYPNAQGSPTIYSPPYLATMFFCGYDNTGNLYVDAQNASSPYGSLYELPSGGSSLQLINVDTTIYEAGPVQWDGQYMTIADYNHHVTYGPELIHRLQISDSSATVIGTTKLNTTRNRHGGQAWIYGAKILTVSEHQKLRFGVGAWKYPTGGKAQKANNAVGHILFGVTVSPSQ